jgi:hypothetical protein
MPMSDEIYAIYTSYNMVCLQQITWDSFHKNPIWNLMKETNVGKVVLREGKGCISKASKWLLNVD